MKIREYGQEDIENEFAIYNKKQKEIALRAEKIKLIHEDTVLIQRLDTTKFYTSLALDSAGEKGRKAQSWYGKVLKISGLDTGDDVKESKKKAIQKGDVVCFNCECAYSLNIKDFEYDIWILSINNIIAVDGEMDLDNLYTEMLKKKVGTKFYGTA